MEQLRQSDLRSIRRTVRDCYALRELSFDDFVRRLVHTLPQLIPAAHVTYNEMYPLSNESHDWVSSLELGCAHASELWAQHMSEHPVLHYAAGGGRRAMRISDFWSRRQLHDRGLHNDFYRLYEIEDALCITVPSPPPCVIGIGWHDKRIFSDRERLIADIVRPHLSQAWRNARIVSRMQRQLQSLNASVESLGIGVIICEPNGRVRMINATACQYLAEYLGITCGVDRLLPDELLQWTRQQNTLLFTTEVPEPLSPAVYHKDGKSLAIRLLTRDGTNMLLMQENVSGVENRGLDRYGLTPREIEVLSWIAKGKTNAEIAVILNTSIGTVKKHVEHVFLKLGVETRTSAAAIALGSNRPGQA
ncbi:MAG TPA: helix-turn-helix transcriptional regulator [Terriglobales bacterium]|nr:helix-turn-helix transcriptional regulator [Terriglobales bacterium]